MKKINCEYLTEDLKRHYQFIQFGGSPYMTYAPEKPMENLPGRDKRVKELSFYGDIRISDILSVINEQDDKDVSRYHLDMRSYDDYGGVVTEFYLNYRLSYKNNKYEEQLAEYEKMMVIYNEEKELLPKLLALYEDWAEKEKTKLEIKQLNGLRKKLLRKGVAID